MSSTNLTYIIPKFEIDKQELEVAAFQGPSLPASDKVHPLVGRWVAITVGPYRGYKGVIRDIGNTSATVELSALFASSVSPRQSFPLHHFRPMYVHYILCNTLSITFL